MTTFSYASAASTRWNGSLSARSDTAGEIDWRMALDVLATLARELSNDARAAANTTVNDGGNVSFNG